MSLQRQQTLIGFEATASAPAGFLVCDAVLDSSIEHAFDFTEHAVEDGSTLTDHLIVKPETISMTLVATDTPIRADTEGFAQTSQQLAVRAVRYGRQTSKLEIQPRAGLPQLNVSSAVREGFKAVAGAGANSISGLKVTGGDPGGTKSLSVTVLTATAPVDRIHDFYARLLEIATSAARVTVTFKGYSYPNYVVTRVGKTDRAGEYGRSTFPVEFRRVRTVQTKQTTLPAVPKAKGKKDVGSKNAKLIGPPEAPPPLKSSLREEQLRRQGSLP